MRKRVVPAVVLACCGIATAGAWLMRVSLASRERELLRHAGLGLAFADSLERSLVSSPAGSISRAEALAALYLKRLRLGLGSPFRLIDQAERDPELEPVGARQVAEAMLARTMIGDAYLPGASALDLIEGPSGWSHRGGSGHWHQAIIDSVISSFDDPRIGELTVRIAYRLASASGVLSRRAPELATAAAAHARDRVLAMRDARALFAASDRERLGRIATLRAWREQGRLAVERPVMLPLTGRAERQAVAALPALVALIESAIRDSTTDGGRAIRGPEERRRSEALALRMAAVAAERDMPPIAPVSIAVRSYSGLLLASDVSWRVIRQRFVNRALSEEALAAGTLHAAEHALLQVRASRPVPAADASALTAAVALRPFAQEVAWLPGDGGPAPRDLQARYGISVTYDSRTRPAWRPWLLRSLDRAVADMKRVFPEYDSRGLRVHFGSSPLGDRALAMHDPLRRTIYFPPISSAGVMAHELAHDLDWQAGRRAFGTTGWYRTDHALRRSSDQLAGALLRMASATRRDTARELGGAGQRPTEIMARNVDWFVSAQLAREGRLNGYLSAAQDPVLAGFASAATPEASHDGGDAALRALDGLTAVPEESRAWFSALYGEDRRVTVHEAVRRVLEAPLARMNVDVVPTQSRAWSSGSALAPSSGDWTCLVDRLADRSGDPGAVRAVVQYAAEARARGVVRMWEVLVKRRPDQAPVRLRVLAGGPWNPGIASGLAREIRDAILLSALSPRGETDWLVTGCGGTER